MGNDIALPNVRRSLHFRIENYEGTNFQSLSPKNQDVLVVKRKLQDLGFDPTELYKDSTHPVNFYERIISELDRMLTLSKGAAQGIINPYQVNFIQIQAHGVMLGQDTLIAVPSSGGGMQYINIQNIAQSFAEVPNSFNIFLIECCRVPLLHWEQQSLDPSALPQYPKKMPGVSIIIHGCDAGQPLVEHSNTDGTRAWCVGTQRFLLRLQETQGKKQYSWMEFFAGYEPSVLTQISSLPYAKWKRLQIFAPRQLFEDYQKQVYRVLSAEPRIVTADPTPQVGGSDMFNIGRIQGGGGAGKADLFTHESTDKQ
ncbi:hypothetical protein FGO68_gene5980 [Halteria grandinella]|uniref:Uncharacterized protein n=1 Tax=Halteria grandinella TaxID=5974 RepID=A0A8J8NJC5_HALGN|nr:hypothetical protein FGO68_gene5980 [Halteria grandinella]